MITIQEFLYLNGVVEDQSKSLISQFPNLKFDTPSQFKNFFESQGISLSISSKTTFNPKDVLLERFKNFKYSSEYSQVKKYIQEEIRLQNELQKSQNSQTVTITEYQNLLNGLSTRPIDPFFNFVIRKILTGSDTGILPSEQIQTLITNLSKSNIKESYDETSDVERDINDRVVNYVNLYKNKGRIRVPVLDERFLLNDFRYILDTSFASLPDAVSSEENVLRKYNDAVIIDNTLGTTEETSKFLSDLKNLINEDSNSIAGLNAKIKNLEDEIKLKDQVISTRIDAEIEHEAYIDSIATDNLQKDTEIESKDETIKELNAQIDTTISKLEQKVSDQLNSTNQAFDNLSKKLEEQSSKQLSAFQNAVAGLAKAVTPPTPTPAPENPAKDIINQILSKWDGMMVISQNSYQKLSDILDLLGATKPSKYSFVFVPPSKGNAYNPSEEIKQHLTWNNQYKPQFKSLISSITDKDKATKILNNVGSILTDSYNTNNQGIYDTVKDSLEAWSIDFGKSRGIGANSVKKIALEVGSPWINVPNNVWDDREGEAKTVINDKTGILSKLTRNSNQLMNVLQFLSEIQTQSGW